MASRERRRVMLARHLLLRYQGFNKTCQLVADLALEVTCGFLWNVFDDACFRRDARLRASVRFATASLRRRGAEDSFRNLLPKQVLPRLISL